jgi:hypothetical protein
VIVSGIHRTFKKITVIKPDTLAECHQVIDSLASQLAALAEQVAVLQERGALNSRNSSKPPSSDTAWLLADLAWGLALLPPGGRGAS